ncbi:MAG: hypothetical protein IKG01_06975 [Lachnospiraceae bacterium]|nr:hypothetical protein [Lachnospiraceae bacterium]
MITYICGSGIRYGGFPGEFWKDVDKLMADGDEILLGDSDFDHRVYGRCRNKSYENVSVIRNSTRIKRLQSRVAALMPSCAAMAAKCDRMIAVWDGESQEAFISILLLLAHHKKCRLYHLPSSLCVEIETPDDLRPYVPAREGWTREDMEEIFKECGFGDQMTGFITGGTALHETKIAEIICKAPVSIKKKRGMLERLQKKNNLNHEVFNEVDLLIKNGSGPELVKQAVTDAFGMSGTYLSNCIKEISNAEAGLKNAIYYLFLEWYYAELFIEKSEPAGMFDSFKQVKEYVRRIEKYCGEDGGSWYRLEAWDRNYGEWGAGLAHTYDYYFYKGEICWFTEFRQERQKDGIAYHAPCSTSFLDGTSNLNLPTPFGPGDIVNVDCRPFGPPFHALITEGRYQGDCCMPQILFKIPNTDRWTVSALKHQFFYKNLENVYYSPALSPLYRLRAVREDELTEDDALLMRIGRELKGDEEKGYEFGRAFPGRFMEGADDGEVTRLWESIKESTKEPIKETTKDSTTDLTADPTEKSTGKST